jgi:hypothetical protein
MIWVWGELEGGALVIEAREHELAALAQARDERVKEACVAARVVDARVVAPGILVRAQHGVAGGARSSERVRLPHYGGRARGHGEAGEEAAEDPVTDDELRERAPVQGMLRGGGEGQQDALLIEGGGQPRDALGGDDEVGRGSAEEGPNVLEGVGAGDEDALAGTIGRRAEDLEHLADRLVPGDQRVAEARERRHLARPEQPLGAGADPAPLDADQEVAFTGHRQLDRSYRDGLRLLQDDRERLQANCKYNDTT